MDLYPIRLRDDLPSKVEKTVLVLMIVSTIGTRTTDLVLSLFDVPVVLDRQVPNPGLSDSL